MSTSENKKMITLMSSDEETFVVAEEVAVLSQTINHMIEDGCADDVIPLPNVTSKTLALVIEYCKRHVEDVDLEAFKANFVKVDRATLFDLMLAANYLNINSLLDLTCQTVAEKMIKGKKADEIREILCIKNDFTPAEEDEVRRENAWAFESGSDDNNYY